MTGHHGRAAIILALALLAGCARKQSMTITGSTSAEVAASIYEIGNALPPDRKDEFTSAIAMLKLTVADKNAEKQISYVTPQLAQMLKGRTPYEVVQMASVYRNAIPSYYIADLPRRHRKSKRPVIQAPGKNIEQERAVAD